MIYVAPVLKEERLHSHYLGEDSYTKVLMNAVQMEMDRRKFNYGLELIESFVPHKGRLLDVGCGPGVFLEVARGSRDWAASKGLNSTPGALSGCEGWEYRSLVRRWNRQTYPPALISA